MEIMYLLNLRATINSSLFFSSNTCYLVCELDYSQVYKYFAEDVRIIKNFNLNSSGPVLILRGIITKADSLRLFFHNNKLEPSDICYHVFLGLDNLLKGNKSIPKNDTIDELKFHNISSKELKMNFKKEI